MAFAPSPAKLCFCTSCRGYLTHVDRHVYAKVAVVGEMLRDVRVKYETIACVNSRLDTIVYASWCRLPSQPSLLSIQLEPVSEAFRLLPRPYQLYNGIEELIALRLLLLFQDEHEMVTKAGLHHDPINSSWQINVRGQEHYVLTLESCDALVLLKKVRHDLLQ